MESISKSQEKLMGMAYAYKKGKLEFKNIDHKYRESIIELSKRFSKDDFEEYMQKSSKDVPEKVIGQHITEPEDLNDEDVNNLEESLKLTPKEMYKHFGFNGPKYGSTPITFFADFDVEKHGAKNKDKGILMDYRDWISK